MRANEEAKEANTGSINKSNEVPEFELDDEGSKKGSTFTKYLSINLEPTKRGKSDSLPIKGIGNMKCFAASPRSGFASQSSLVKSTIDPREPGKKPPLSPYVKSTRHRGLLEKESKIP